MTSCDYLSLQPNGVTRAQIAADKSRRLRRQRRHRTRYGLARLANVTDMSMVLDDAGMAVLHQILVGIASADALAYATNYVDEEGTPVATRDGDRVVSLVAVPWAMPDEVRSDRGVVVATPGEIPADLSSLDDLVVLLPLGGVRPDDTRTQQWATAWRANPNAVVVEVPVPPASARDVTPTLVAAYSTGIEQTVATQPQPGTGGHVVFFTGLSGSGKSTIARELVRSLAATRTVTLLDGDVVRTHLSKGLGFSREDRDTNIRRIGWVAAEIAKHGGIAVCAPIAPYDEARRWARETVERSAGPGSFTLVWVATPLEVCEARDVKGLYAQARAGELSGFTGIDDPYEPPNDADIVVDTAGATVAESVDRVRSGIRLAGGM